MSSEPEDPEDPQEPGQERPSKSARKRAAHAAQDLGEELIKLSDAQLEALGLPEQLADAVRLARRIPSRGGGARQRQFIGKLMRASIRSRSGCAQRPQRRGCARHRALQREAWRERLISEGAAALSELASWRPDIDQADWARRVAAARVERARLNAGGAASRKLFRALRTLFDTMP